MAKATTPITDPREVSPATKPVHGLDPEEERFMSQHGGAKERIEKTFAINRELILPVADVAALKLAEEKLAKQTWAERVEWSELGQLSLDTKPTTDSSGGNASASGRAIAIGGSTTIAEARNKGFFNLQAAFERGIKTEFEEEKDVSREVLDAAMHMAKEAVAATLPSQAFMFVPVDELFKVQQEAEKLARDFAKECINTQKNPDKDTMKKGGKSDALKSSVRTKMRGLSMRHDGAMHIFPYSQQYAPETGIATVAAIESRYQSITGDHGRAQIGTR